MPDSSPASPTGSMPDADAPTAASAAPPRRGRGRPRTPAVTREAIATAALAVAREDGYDGLTMAAVARRLGVGASALYNHVRGKTGLLALLEDEVMGEVDTRPLLEAAAGRMPVRDALRDWAHSYRRVIAAHTPLIPIIAVLPVAGAERTQDLYDAVSAALQAAGVPDAQVMPRVIALESFIYGSALDVHAPAHLFEVPAVPGRTPHFRAASLAYRGAADPDAPAPLGQNPYADGPFEAGLELLLAGL